jgi:hypothetical protein
MRMRFKGKKTYQSKNSFMSTLNPKKDLNKAVEM